MAQTLQAKVTHRESAYSHKMIPCANFDHIHLGCISKASEAEIEAS